MNFQKTPLALGLCLLIFLSSCKKELSSPEETGLTPAKKSALAFLKATLSESQLSDYDLAEIGEGKTNKNVSVELLHQKNDKNKLLLMTADSGFATWSACSVHIRLDATGSGTVEAGKLNGPSRIVVFQNRKVVGIAQNDPVKTVNTSGRKTNYESTDLPPVTVECVRHNNPDPLLLTSLYWLTDQSPAFTNVFLDLNSTASSSPSYYLNYGVAYEMEEDDSPERQSVALYKLFTCFSSVPNTDATYSVKLCTDIPVNSLPFLTFNVLDGSPGHAFLVLTKTSGNQSVTQTFGFYPAEGTKAATTYAVPHAIKDDSGHEINASIEMPGITESAFNMLLTNSITESQNDYRLNEFNCTDFALNVFNSIRGDNPILVPSSGTIGGRTPAGLYTALNNLRNAGTKEFSNISVTKTSAPNSHGECN